VHEAEVQLLVESEIGLVPKLDQVVCMLEGQLGLFGAVDCHRLQIIALTHVVLDKLVQFFLFEEPIQQFLRLLSQHIVHLEFDGGLFVRAHNILEMLHFFVKENPIEEHTLIESICLHDDFHVVYNMLA
jgi:hypothetical protein